MFKSTFMLGSVLTALLSTVNAAAVRGKPEGFGSKATGGGSGPQVTPNTNAELINYLKQSGPLTIVITKTFDFRGTEGTATETGCAPYGTGASCQLAINAGNWCNTEQAKAPKVKVTYDKAGTNPLMVSSDKTVLGVGRNGVVRGKGFRLAGGTNNVILQNLEIRDLNPQYVWGGDAITLDGSSNVWIDHIKVCQSLSAALRKNYSKLTLPADFLHRPPAHRNRQRQEHRRDNLQRLYRWANQLVPYVQ